MLSIVLQAPDVLPVIEVVPDTILAFRCPLFTGSAATAITTVCANGNFDCGYCHGYHDMLLLNRARHVRTDFPLHPSP